MRTERESERETEGGRGGRENNAVANVPLDVVDRESGRGKTLAWPFCSGRDRTGWCSLFPGFGNAASQIEPLSQLSDAYLGKQSEFLPS